jgi:hypothetical protein
MCHPLALLLVQPGTVLFFEEDFKQQTLFENQNQNNNNNKALRFFSSKCKRARLCAKRVK